MSERYRVVTHEADRSSQCSAARIVGHGCAGINVAAVDEDDVVKIFRLTRVLNDLCNICKSVLECLGIAACRVHEISVDVCRLEKRDSLGSDIHGFCL